ncbi:hypothetical protein GHK86_04865 [Acidimicrobiaceae bacterium USS-CC1]|uniref:NADP-dependent oxidoreductase domain-containing protein n=1 Tax=Acidiferrimicrobium australe TaxID=2664430 RepID=A0ABW9QQG7_9ACTN|nr:hypothetical protein [Acidiferrimicrobium australe]
MRSDAGTVPGQRSEDDHGPHGPMACRLGFGCASLFRLRGRRERLRLLACAYDNGIEHFDTAPMYGLGASERELGAFASGPRGNVTLLTKFGRSVAPLGRAARPLQAPLGRRVTAALDTIAREGVVRRVNAALYRPPDYGVAAARGSLEASCRRLGRDRIDILAVHDPPPGVLPPDDLPGWLDEACASGRVGAWGLAGHHSTAVAWGHHLDRPLPVLQYQSDYRSAPVAGMADSYITYGFLRGQLARIRSLLDTRPDLCEHWSGRLQMSLAGDGLADALLEHELAKNVGGVVLIASSREQRIVRAATVAHRHAQQRPAERIRRAAILTDFATACRLASG